MNLLLQLVIQQVKDEAIGIRSYELVDPLGKSLPNFTAGSHVDVYLEGGRVRQYSLCNDPQESHRYVIAVLREPNGRGGSCLIHSNFRRGSKVSISVPRNTFPLASDAAHHLLIAGGIGITPIISMARYLERLDAEYTLHYCARSPKRAAFHKELTTAPFACRTAIHFDDGVPSRGLDIRALLEHQAQGQHIYCCGPVGLMDAVAAATSGWQRGTVHFEYFKPRPEAASREGRERAARISPSRLK